MVGSATIAIEEVSVEDTWARLRNDAGSFLIDVRTMAEWAFVGVPDVSSIGKELLRVEWQSFPDNRMNPGFAGRLTEMLDKQGVGRDSELLFICRSGGRSLMAARVMVAAGFTRCRNVTHGFEGPLDPKRHRGHLEGWKARGLPWAQG